MYLHEMPGFVDLQVNGFMNVDFTSIFLTDHSFMAATTALIEQGTAAYCPTVVTASDDVYKRNLPLIAEIMSRPENAGRFLGLHLEGPFLSPQPGARGVHDEKCIRRPSIDYFKWMYDLAGGNVSILTLAPEEPGAIKLIEYAVSLGVVVSIGHHIAEDSVIDAAISAGAKACTHIGNGLPNMIPRHNNPLWKQLSDDRLWGMFITDGHHLPVPLIHTAIRTKGLDRFIVTSDAAALAGMPIGVYGSFGKEVEVEASGRIFCPETGSLAGSHSTMMECINFLASLNVLTWDELIRVGLHNPLELIGRSVDDITQVPGGIDHTDNRFKVALGDNNG